MIVPAYSDGIGSIAVIGNTVRVDFVVLSPEELDGEGRPKPVTQQRIVMPLDAFLRASDKIQEAAQAIARLGHAARPPSGEDKPAAPPAKPPFP